MAVVECRAQVVLGNHNMATVIAGSRYPVSECGGSRLQDGDCHIRLERSRESLRCRQSD